MTVSLQLTPWALPSLLAVLGVLREATYLWPQRREPTVPVVLVLLGASGLWAFMHGFAVVSPSAVVETAVAQGEYLPAAVATIAVLVFAVGKTGGGSDLWRWPMVVLYLVAGGLAILALREDATSLFIRGAEPARYGTGQGVALAAGPAHWIALMSRVGAALAATVLLLRGRTEPRLSPVARVWIILAGILMTVPAAAQLIPGPQPYWTNLSGAGFAVASVALTWGLLRPGLLGVGPVARKLVMHALRDPIVVFDGRGRIVDVNRAAAQGLGLEPFRDVPLALGTLWASTKGAAQDVPSVHLDVRSQDGSVEERSFDVTVTPLQEDGEALRSALLLRDVTQRDHMQAALMQATEALADANEELKHLALTDPLTGLANRRHFSETLEREVERSGRYGRPLSLLLLDLDHFKGVNDTHGHAAGDDVLRAAARVLQGHCRDVDLAARMGGEELAILLPETGAAGAAAVAERVREEMEGLAHTSPEGVSFTVTTSIGVAAVNGGEGSGEALLHASDAALYDAKARGRNRVVVAS